MSPSKVRESWAPSQPDVTVVLAASRGAGCACECCKSCRIGASGLRRSHHCLAVSGGPRWCSEQFRRPDFQRSRGHPRVRFALLQSWSCPRRPVRFRSRAPSMGSGSSSRRRSSESTCRRASQARLRSAHSVSHALDGLLLAESCRSISLCCHVQDSASGLLPRPSRTTSSVAIALAPLAPRLCRRCYPTTPSRVASTSGPCSRPGSGARPRGVSPRPCPCPFACVSLGL